MKLFVRNTVNGLLPLYPSDLDEKKKLKIGEDYEVSITIPRNYEFLKKFMAMVAVGHDNTSLDMPRDTYRKYLTIKAGYFNAYSTKKGVFYEAQSISFANMTEDMFQEVYSRVLDEVIKDIGITSEEIEKKLIGFM